VSESRVGWNKAYLARLDKFLSVIGPNQPAEIMPYGRRVASFSVSGLFGTAHSEILTMAGTAYSLEQKFSRGFQRHLVKAGFRFLRETGSHINPEDPAFTYQTYAELLTNVVNSHNTTYGAPPHGSRMDQYGAFIQDDWRLGNHFVLNLGLRWIITASRRCMPRRMFRWSSSTWRIRPNLRKMDFGPKRDPLHPYEPDGNNIGPRVGFAWTLGENEATVVRGRFWLSLQPHAAHDGSTGRESPDDSVPGGLQPDGIGSAKRQVAYVHGRRVAIGAGRLGWEARRVLADTTPTSPRLIRFSRCSVCSAPSAARWLQKSATSGPMATISRCSVNYSGVRQTDRCAAQHCDRLSRRLLRGQQPDDGLQRPADIAPKAVL
jgi:hypothetical protein